MTDRLIPLKEVKDIAGIKKTSIYRLMGEGKFPRPKRPDGFAGVRWEEREVRAWKDRQPLAERRAG